VNQREKRAAIRRRIYKRAADLIGYRELIAEGFWDDMADALGLSEDDLLKDTPDETLIREVLADIAAAFERKAK